MGKIRSNIPNSITCLNVLFGTAAIIMSSYAGDIIGGMRGWQWSLLFIALAAVADFFDGFVARLLHESHPIGAQLDSLSDQVSFGVAPAVLTAFCLMGKVPMWLVFTPAVIPVATAVRLAKFNIDTRQTTGFLGMPVPANAIFWMGYATYLEWDAEWLGQPWILIPSLLLMAWLMVSEVPMLSLKFKTWGLRENMARYLLILGSVALVAGLWLRGLVWIIVLYVALSLIFAGRRPSAETAGH